MYLSEIISFQLLIEWFSLGNDLALPQGTFGDIFGCHSSGRVLLAFSRQRAGLLLNILQCTVQPLPPLIKNYPKQSIRSAGVEKSCTKWRKEDLGSVSGNQRAGEKERWNFVLLFVWVCSVFDWVGGVYHKFPPCLWEG